MQNEAWEPMLFVQALKEYLLYLDYLHESQGIVKSLHFFSLGNILRSLLYVRRVTTRKEELKVLADMVFEDDPRYV